MNFALSDEQVLLREAARGSLSRFKTVEAAREALEDPSALPDLWPVAVEAGWPGLLVSEEQGVLVLMPSTQCSWPRSAAACSRACHCSACCPRVRSSTPRATSR